MVSRGIENDQFFQIPLILEVKIGGDHSNSSAVCGTGKKKRRKGNYIWATSNKLGIGVMVRVIPLWYRT